MENASKALIIAGAILLAILIISLGIMIFNQASGVVNNNAMSEVEVTQFNSKFTQYEGTAVRGATVNAMLQAVLTSNMSQDSDDRKVAVEGVGAMEKSATALATARAQTGSTYTIECTYGTTGGSKGLVTSIKVTKNGASANP